MKPPMSHRGHDLAWSTRDDFDQPIVTVELWVKWYGIWIVFPGEKMRALESPFPQWRGLIRKGSPYVDHVPNPRCVEAFADLNGYTIDDLAAELMIGRWELEVNTMGEWQ